jgi:hypothetical protein
VIIIQLSFKVFLWSACFKRFFNKTHNNHNEIDDKSKKAMNWSKNKGDSMKTFRKRTNIRWTDSGKNEWITTKIQWMENITLDRGVK